MSVDLAKPQPPPPRKSAICCGMIRLTGFLLALVSLAGLVAGFSLVMGAWQRHSHILVILVLFAGVLFFTALFLIGYRMLRQVSRATVCNFACMCSASLTVVFIYFLSEGVVETMGQSMGLKGDGWDWLYHPDIPLLKIVMVLVAFLACYYGIKFLLLHATGLKHPPPKPAK